MNLDEFLADKYLEEIDRHNYDYNDVWNPNYDPMNPNKPRESSTGIQLDMDRPFEQPPAPAIPPPVEAPQAGAPTQVKPQFFDMSSGHLLIPDGFARRIAQEIYQELMGRVEPKHVREAVRLLSKLLSGIHLSDGEVETSVKPLSPTLASLYNEFKSLKRSDEDILDFGSAVIKLLNIVDSSAKQTPAA